MSSTRRPVTGWVCAAALGLLLVGPSGAQADPPGPDRPSHPAPPADLFIDEPQFVDRPPGCPPVGVCVVVRPVDEGPLSHAEILRRAGAGVPPGASPTPPHPPPGPLPPPVPPVPPGGSGGTISGYGYEPLPEVIMLDELCQRFEGC